MFISELQGDTLENVAKELECIIETGNYTICLEVCPGVDLYGEIKAQLFLEYTPYSITSSSTNIFSSTSSTTNTTTSSPSIHVLTVSHQEVAVSQENHMHCRMERKTDEQIKDFVRKLGFMDREKDERNFIKQFLHVSQVGLNN